MKIRIRAFRLCLFVIVIIGAAVLAPFEARAQDDNLPPPPPTSSRGGGRGTIVGRVVLPSGQPVSSPVRITLSNIRDPDLTIFSDNNGGFGFPNLVEATYTIEVSGDSKLYETVSQEVRLFRGSIVRVLINLKAKSTAPPNKTGGVVSAAEIDPNVPGPAKKEYEKGIKLAQEGKLDEAIARFKQAIAIYSNYLMARNDLGVQYLKLKRTTEAAQEFEAAIEINPKAFNPRLNLGIVLVEQKKYTDALDQLRLAASIDSSSPAAHLYLGIALVETDEIDTALRELSSALSMGGLEYAIAHYYLAHVHMKKGQREEAISALNTYLEKSPKGEQSARARELLDQLKQL